MSVFEEVRSLISEQFGVDVETIEGTSHLQGDLNADPLSIADLASSLEAKFKIKIPQEEVMKFDTVSDIVNFVEDQGNIE